MQSYELRDRRTSKGEFIDANIQLKMKRDEASNNRIIEYLREFTDVTMSAAEG